MAVPLNEMLLVEKRPNLKPDRSNSKDNEPFEQRLWESCPCSLFAHDHWAQLAMVANENQLPASQHNWDHAFRFSRLRALVNQNRTKLEEKTVGKKFNSALQLKVFSTRMRRTRSSPQWWSGRSTIPHDVLNLWLPIYDASVWGTWGLQWAHSVACPWVPISYPLTHKVYF